MNKVASEAAQRPAAANEDSISQSRVQADPAVLWRSPGTEPPAPSVASPAPDSRFELPSNSLLANILKQMPEDVVSRAHLLARPDVLQRFVERHAAAIIARTQEPGYRGPVPESREAVERALVELVRHDTGVTAMVALVMNEYRELRSDRKDGSVASVRVPKALAHDLAGTVTIPKLERTLEVQGKERTISDASRGWLDDLNTRAGADHERRTAAFAAFEEFRREHAASDDGGQPKPTRDSPFARNPGTEPRVFNHKLVAEVFVGLVMGGKKFDFGALALHRSARHHQMPKGDAASLVETVADNMLAMLEKRGYQNQSDEMTPRKAFDVFLSNVESGRAHYPKTEAAWELADRTAEVISQTLGFGWESVPWAESPWNKPQDEKP